MKKTTLLLTLLCTSIAMSKTLYVTGDNIPVFDSKGQQIGVMARGTFGEEISQSGDKTTIKVQGYIKKDDNKTLYATKNLMMPLISFNGTNTQTNLEVSIATANLSDDQSKAWADAEFLYYDTCSMCHSAHAPKEHTMIEWDGVFNTMRAFAMPTDKEADMIIQYLRAHATDGYATDDEDDE